MTNTPKKSVSVDLGEIDLRLSSTEVSTSAIDAQQAVADAVYNSDNQVSSVFTGFFGTVQRSGEINVWNKLSWTNLKLFIKEFMDGFYFNPATLTDIGVPASSDKIILQDASDSDTIKYASFSQFTGDAARNLDTYTSSQTLSSANDFAIFNGPFLVCTLPDASSVTGLQFEIKNINISQLTIQTSLGQFLDSDSSITLNQWEVLKVISDGSNYLII